jgi:phosphoribosylamine--glycine ligase
VKAMVLGSGAREHVISWLLSKSKQIKELYVAPGNAGTAKLANNLPKVDPLDTEALLAKIKRHKVDFVFIGPEAPAAFGVADILKSYGIQVIGPPKQAARLEASKSFAKEFLIRHHIPTASARQFSSALEFEDYIRSVKGEKLVVKKSGLASGKGVLESSSREELIDFGKNILNDDLLLVEEYLKGWEVSVFALSDGRDYQILPPCTDFKKAHDGDSGPNTGGMGSICPVPTINPQLWQEIKAEIVEPTFRGLNQEGLNYQGILYFGLMITAQGPYVLEYNIRLGDPEAQVLLPLIDTDFGIVCEALLRQKLKNLKIKIKNRAALGVVIASDGYPGDYRKNVPVTSLPQPPEKEALIFHASTELDSRGRVFTKGGRCFTMVGLGGNLAQAKEYAYKYANKVHFEGSWFRSDIGKKFIERL